MLLYEPFTSWLGLGSAEKLEATSSRSIKWESGQFLPGENLAFPGEINTDWPTGGGWRAVMLLF